ncbi:MAG: DUF1501 domain-containing protein [Saprospiraceae bacterium]|nr:DUF1501 domain-containing protein [Saprospiraceae bacterium]
MKSTRRAFLKATGLATSSLFIPNFLKAFEMGNSSFNGKRLVIIQLSGGNDGLNTVVPFRNDIYYRLRPKLALGHDQIIQLNDELAFNKVMTGLADIYNNGLMTVINNVGYPNPNRSHFRSMDIWQTASREDEFLHTGWIGRYLDNECAGSCQAHTALEIDGSLSLAMKGHEVKGMSMENVQQLLKMTDDDFTLKVAHSDHHHEHEEVEYLYKTLRETVSSAEYIEEKSKLYTSKEAYPLNEFGKRLKTIAKFINSGIDTSVYYAGLTGFDTHAAQRGTQNNLLRKFSDGIYAFVKDLHKNNNLDDTLIMVFSEFGRRVKQNASGGTDHGAANNLFLIGGGLNNPGFFNESPNLMDLDKGDIKYTVDFRQVYATLLEDWLGSDSEAILNERFDKLNVIRS